MKDADDIAKFIVSSYGPEYLYEFKKNNNSEEFVITKSDKKKKNRILNCEKCSKLIVSFNDKKSYYLTNKCHLCGVAEQ